MDRVQQTTFPTHNSELVMANKFGKFYYEKIKQIRDKFLFDSNSMNIKPLEPVNVDSPLEKFEPIT